MLFLSRQNGLYSLLESTIFHAEMTQFTSMTSSFLEHTVTQPTKCRFLPKKITKNFFNLTCDDFSELDQKFDFMSKRSIFPERIEGSDLE